MAFNHPPLLPDDVPFDPDSPEWTEADFTRAKAEEHLLPPVLQAWLKRSRGRPRLEVTKTEVKLRLDPDVVERFRADGPGWQSRMNAALRKAAGL